MDNAYEMIQTIETKMVNTLSNDDMSKLDRVLTTVVSDYDVVPRVTDIAIRNTDNEMALEYFSNLLRLNGKSEGTINQYITSTQKLFDYLGKHYKDITVMDLRRYFVETSMGIRETTYNNYVTYINQFFAWLSDEGYIAGNPMKKILKVREERTIKTAFTDGERECLRNHATCKRDKAILEFLYSTGMRVGEVPPVDIADIKNDQLIIYGKKTKKERVVFLSDTCLYYLEDYLKDREDDNPALFVTNRKIRGEYKRLTECAIQTMMRGLGRRCGMTDVYPHKMRRTFGINLMAHGADIIVVKELLGHTNIQTTQMYIDSTKLDMKHKHKICI